LVDLEDFVVENMRVDVVLQICGYGSPDTSWGWQATKGAG
jgi:hypothetical protein